MAKRVQNTAAFDSLVNKSSGTHATDGSQNMEKVALVMRRDMLCVLVALPMLTFGL